MSIASALMSAHQFKKAIKATNTLGISGLGTAEPIRVALKAFEHSQAMKEDNDTQAAYLYQVIKLCKLGSRT